MLAGAIQTGRLSSSPSRAAQELASSLGIYPEVAASLAEQWRGLAPPPSAMLEAARRAARRCAGEEQWRAQDGEREAGAADAGRSSGGGVPGYSGGGAEGEQQRHQQQQLADWWIQRRRREQRRRARRGAGASRAGRGSSGGGSEGDELLAEEADAADAASVELGLRQLSELGVEAAVMGALAEQARARRAVVQLPQAVSASYGTHGFPSARVRQWFLAVVRTRTGPAA